MIQSLFGRQDKPVFDRWKVRIKKWKRKNSRQGKSLNWECFGFDRDEVRLDKQAGWKHLKSQKKINADNRIAA